MRIQHMKKQGTSLIPLVLLLALLSGCSLMPQVAHHPVAPFVQPITAPYQPFRTVQLCLDGLPIFSPSNFHLAATLIAHQIDQAVTVNQGGMSVYVTLITSDSYQNDALQFAVPAFPADPPPPLQPKQGDNPYDNAAMQSLYQKAFASWQTALATQHKKLAALRQQVKQQTDTLRALQPIFDPVADDIYGCLQDASQHFQGTTGDNYLIIASPMLVNTVLQASHAIALAHASVRVVFHTCQVASTCQATQAYWTRVLLQDGATDVRFFDPAQSVLAPSLFSGGNA